MWIKCQCIRKKCFFENRQAAFSMQGYINHFLYCSLKIEKKILFQTNSNFEPSEIRIHFLPFSDYNFALCNKSLDSTRIYFFENISFFWGGRDMKIKRIKTMNALCLHLIHTTLQLNQSYDKCSKRNKNWHEVLSKKAWSVWRAIIDLCYVYVSIHNKQQKHTYIFLIY